MATEEWAQGLGDLGGEQIQRGLAAWDSDWPPTLPEFRKACLGTTEGLSHNTAAYRRFKRALPRPKADPEGVKVQIQKMREALK